MESTHDHDTVGASPNGVTDLLGTGEPVFILRASDPAAVAALMAYYNWSKIDGASERKLKGLRQAIDTFERHSLPTEATKP